MSLFFRILEHGTSNGTSLLLNHMFGFFDFSLVRKLILEFKSLRLIFFCSLLTLDLHLKHLTLQLLDLGLCFKQCLLCLVELVT